MSIQEIVDRLPELTPAELEELDARLQEARKRKKYNSFQELMEDLAGKAEGLPEDFAAQHDHYLYGVPKR
jgi:hypothetical protein